MSGYSFSPFFDKEGDSLFKPFWEVLPEALCHLDPQGKVVFFNSSFWEIMGKPDFDLKGRGLEELGFPPEVSKILLRMMESAIKKRSPSRGEFLLKVEEDGVHLFEGVLLPKVEKDGTISSYLLVFRDLTELKRIKLPSQEEEIICPSLDTLQEAIFFCDKEGGLIYGNQPFERISSLPIPNFLNKDWLSLVHPEDKEKALGLFQEALGGNKVEKEIRFLHPERGEIWLNLTLAPLSCYFPEQMGIQGRAVETTEKRMALERLERSLGVLRKSVRETVQAMAAIVEARDPFTAGHQEKVSRLAATIADEMGFSTERKEQIRLGALVHDLGKISIPLEILTKPARLNEKEMALVRLHPEVGFSILKKVEHLQPIGDMVLQHHERLGGSGYPKGLKQDQISMEGRILAVADVVEAMASPRPYRPSLGISGALEEVNRNKGKLYDPLVVEACTRIFQERRFKLE